MGVVASVCERVVPYLFVFVRVFLIASVVFRRQQRIVSGEDRWARSEE